MEITDIRIRKIDSESRMRGVASITIDNAFAVHDIKIIEGKERLFIAMPSRQTPNSGFRDIAHPINSNMRGYIEDLILNAYNEISKADAV